MGAFIMDGYICDLKSFEQYIEAGLKDKFHDFLLAHKKDIHKYNCSKEFGFFDTEQSLLSKMIWKIIFQEYYKESAGFYYLNCSKTYSIYEINEKENIKIFFDVMNNCDEIRDVYHRIGNYCVYPSMDRKPQLQNIHKYYGERWDKLLLFLRKNWETCQVEYITIHNEMIVYEQEKSFKDKWGGLCFNEYMILTCQHMYFQEIFDQIDMNKNVTIEDFKRWNQLIRENPNYELIKIDNLEKMKALIDIRGKLIASILVSGMD